MKWQDKFNLKQTSKPYYTSVLHGKKNAVGIVYEVRTEDFIGLTGSHEIKTTDRMTILFEDSTYKWNLPYYDINFGRVDGLHRVSVCLNNKMPKVPVLFVGMSKDHIEAWLEEEGIKAKCVNMEA